MEFSEYLLVTIGFLGLGYTQHIKGHIAVEAIYDRLGRRVKRGFRIVDMLICLSFSIVCIWASYQKAFDFTLQNETAWFGDVIVPVWFVRWAVPIGFVGLFLQFTLELIDEIKTG